MSQTRTVHCVAIYKSKHRKGLALELRVNLCSDDHHHLLNTGQQLTAQSHQPLCKANSAISSRASSNEFTDPLGSRHPKLGARTHSPTFKWYRKSTSTEDKDSGGISIGSSNQLKPAKFTNQLTVSGYIAQQLHQADLHD